MSVRPSVTRQYYVDAPEHILKIFPPSGSHTVLVFLGQYSDGILPPNGALNTGGVYKFRNFQPISRFTLEMIRDKPTVTMVMQI